MVSKFIKKVLHQRFFPQISNEFLSSSKISEGLLPNIGCFPFPSQRSLGVSTMWKVSRYGAFSGPYLNTFHAVKVFEKQQVFGRVVLQKNLRKTCSDELRFYWPVTCHYIVRKKLQYYRSFFIVKQCSSVYSSCDNQNMGDWYEYYIQTFFLNWSKKEVFCLLQMTAALWLLLLWVWQ